MQRRGRHAGDMGAILFEGSHLRCRWMGRALDQADLDRLAADVRERVFDLAFSDEVEAQMRDLAQTDFSTEWLDSFLAAGRQNDVLPWQVGEALVEAVLEAEFAVVLPWNTKRDQRTPKASLPGADLVGLCQVNDEWHLVFGEIKSSSDKACPPGVVHGKSGLVQQLERILNDPSVQFELIRWLMARVPDGELSSGFSEALTRFVNTRGAGTRLIGSLVRDTSPNELDVSTRGRNLGGLIGDPGTAELHVWYLPIPMADWPGLVAA